jgi:hypothetical protein
LSSPEIQDSAIQQQPTGRIGPVRVQLNDVATSQEALKSISGLGGAVKEILAKSAWSLDAGLTEEVRAQRHQSVSDWAHEIAGEPIDGAAPVLHDNNESLITVEPVGPDNRPGLAALTKKIDRLEEKMTQKACDIRSDVGVAAFAGVGVAFSTVPLFFTSGAAGIGMTVGVAATTLPFAVAGIACGITN